MEIDQSLHLLNVHWHHHLHHWGLRAHQNGARRRLESITFSATNRRFFNWFWSEFAVLNWEGRVYEPSDEHTWPSVLARTSANFSMRVREVTKGHDVHPFTSVWVSLKPPTQRTRGFASWKLRGRRGACPRSVQNRGGSCPLLPSQLPRPCLKVT